MQFSEKFSYFCKNEISSRKIENHIIYLINRTGENRLKMQVLTSSIYQYLLANSSNFY